MTIEYWTTTDALNGLCEMEDVGDVRETERIAPPTPAPLEADDLMSDDIFETEMAAYRADPARYRSSNASNLNKLLDVAARRQEKREEAPQIALDKLAASDFEKLSMADLKRVLIEVVLQHVPDDRQADALRMLRR